MTEEETFKKKYPEYCCGKALLSPYWDLWEDGTEYGYNKANEWHYVKDGDLPKVHGWYWVQYNNDTFDCLIVTINLRFLNHQSIDVTDCIYAWKEIVPPKEIE